MKYILLIRKGTEEALALRADDILGLEQVPEDNCTLIRYAFTPHTYVVKQDIFTVLRILEQLHGR
jgi:hypothetical protein